MNRTRHIAIFLTLLVCASSAAIVCGQPRSVAPRTPEALVADLYRAQKTRRGPFFQTRSRALVDKYFSKSLGDLIWKDARTSKGEVGVIDGDPLYDAQDMEIKHFAIGKSVSESADKTKVPVTFENFGEKKTITFILSKGAAGWRIDDIDYGGARTLRSEFKEGQ
jgi:hypothetical protein